MTIIKNCYTSVILQGDIDIWLTSFHFRMVCCCPTTCSMCSNASPEFKHTNADILSISSGYNNTSIDYLENSIVDINSNAVNTFTDCLAKEIFGSSEIASFIINRDSIQSAIASELVDACDRINDSIDVNGSTYAAVTSGSSTGYKIVKDIYDSINNTDRLKLYYNFVTKTCCCAQPCSMCATTPLPASSTINDLEDCIKHAHVIIKTDSNSAIIELIVKCHGSNYIKGDSVTFTDGIYSIISSSITSYQAAAFNGTLQTSDIEFPFVVGDIINFSRTIESGANEVDASRDPIIVKMIVYLKTKLV